MIEVPLFTTKFSNLTKIEYSNGIVDMLGYQSPRMKHRLGLSTGISLFTDEGGMYTGSLDYFASPNINLELNLGGSGTTEYYSSFGSKLYLANKNSTSGFSPFVGVLYGNESGYSFFEVPVGLSYITKFGFQTSLQLSALDYLDYTYQSAHIEWRIGWRL